jgi:hypothetical protein
LINCPPSTAIGKKTPIEVWFDSPHDSSQLIVLGCTIYAYIDNGKLEPRAINCIFLGYDSSVKPYKLWNLETQKDVLSRNIVFNESTIFTSNSSVSPTN